MRDLSFPTLLFLDTETSGLYRTDLSIDDPGQPWAMSISALLCNTAGTVTNAFSHLIKPEGRKSKQNATNVHGLGDHALAQVGVPENRVLGLLTDMLKTAPLDAMKVITYGDFDRMIIASLLSRLAIFLKRESSHFDRLWLARPRTEFVNLMVPYAQQACRIPGTGAFEGADQFKWPSLDEAATAILGLAPREGFHDSWQDLLILKDLYFEFLRRGHFDRAAAA